MNPFWASLLVPEALSWSSLFQFSLSALPAVAFCNASECELSINTRFHFVSYCFSFTTCIREEA